jgi:peroxiredoxin
LNLFSQKKTDDMRYVQKMKPFLSVKRVFGLFLPILSIFLMQANYPETGYKVGDTAIDFKLKNVDGKMLSLAGINDAKGYIVIFTCNHCPFSKMYEDRIIALHQKYASKGYPVVAINPNDAQKEPEDAFEKMVERAKEKNFPFVYLQDQTQEIAKTYGAARTPHVYILGKDLKVMYIGAIDNNPQDAAKADSKYVENAVDELLAGRKPSLNSTKAVGCTIKWAK